MKTITGNLLDIQAGVILHQVNCRGVVGGLAGTLHRKYPMAFTDYFLRCEKNQSFALGQFLLCKATPALFIGHVFGQLNPGANTDMDAVNESFGAAIAQFHDPQPALFAPYKMGCGLGGGAWSQYEEMLEACFPDITIVQRPEDAP